MSLIPPDQKKVKIENIIAPKTALEFTAFVGVTVLISLLSAGNIFGVGGVAAVGFSENSQFITEQPVEFPTNPI